MLWASQEVISFKKFKQLVWKKILKVQITDLSTLESTGKMDIGR